MSEIACKLPYHFPRTPRTVVSIIGSERCRKIKDEAIAVFKDLGYCVLDIEGEHGKTMSGEHVAKLIKQSNLIFLASDGRVEYIDVIYIGIAFENSIPVISSSMLASAFKDFVTGTCDVKDLKDRILKKEIYFWMPTDISN